MASPSYTGYRVSTQLVREGRATRKVDLSNDERVARFMRGLVDRDREVFCAILVDVKNVAIGVHEVSVGTLDATIVQPREVFKAAILASAASVILAHNHPSGDPEPSPEDMKITRQMVDAGEVLGIPVLDHVIVGDGEHVGLASRGLV